MSQNPIRRTSLANRRLIKPPHPSPSTHKLHRKVVVRRSSNRQSKLIKRCNSEPTLLTAGISIAAVGDDHRNMTPPGDSCLLFQSRISTQDVFSSSPELLPNSPEKNEPDTKSGRWAEQVWRRVKRPAANMLASSSHLPDKIDEIQPKNTDDRKIFKVPVEESKHWSKDAVEFYNNGDAPFCYTRFSGWNKLDRNFWGTLLGYQSNGNLSPTHIEAWTNYLMRSRQAMLLRNPDKKQRWTVMPPSFFDDMRSQESMTAIELATGRNEPYPSFLEVNHVYIPLWIYGKDWLLVRIDLRTMVITQYWIDRRWRDKNRADVRHYMESLTMFFPWFLDRMNYWRNSKHPVKVDISVGLVEVDVPQDKGNIANAGVLVCMMMEKLVKNKSLKKETDTEEACSNYRSRMADVLYKWRCTPQNS